MIDLPENCKLPAGYRWGAHWSTSDHSGYWLIRDDDDASVRARIRPDLSVGTDEEADAEAQRGGSSILTRSDIRDRIRDAFAELDSVPY